MYKGMKLKFAIVILSMLVTSAMTARSPKRGICWDEKTQKLTNAPINKMLPGVSWLYTWGEKPLGNPSKLATRDGIAFMPMAWGKNYDEQALRDYISAHPNVRYLLGFNEPNFAEQAAMTPFEAADAWPKLEKIAADYHLKLVAPALNFTGQSVGGKVWGIYDWLNDFIGYYSSKYRKLPKIDCLALHCYMNWYSATTWFATEYFYSDIFKDGNNTKYPHIVSLLNTAKSDTGQYPRMMLTEFCSWEGDKDGFVTNVENQIDQMTQRVQKLEQSDLVEGYAWFMANADASQYPYMSVFQTNTPQSQLSDLGKVYVNMSAFDRNKFYAPGEEVQAKDYVDATADNLLVRVRPNSESGSTRLLQITLAASTPNASAFSEATYQIDIPEAGNYTITLHAKADAGGKARIRIPGTDVVTDMDLTAHPDEWADYTAPLILPAGRNSLKIANISESPLTLSFWKIESNSAIADIRADFTGPFEVYTLQGIRLGSCASLDGLEELNLTRGVYLLAAPDGTSRKTVI